MERNRPLALTIVLIAVMVSTVMFTLTPFWKLRIDEVGNWYRFFFFLASAAAFVGLVGIWKMQIWGVFVYALFSLSNSVILVLYALDFIGNGSSLDNALTRLGGLLGVYWILTPLVPIILSLVSIEDFHWRWDWPFLAPIILATACFIAYCNTFSSPFILDDPDQVVNNAGIRTLWPLSGLFAGDNVGQLTRPAVYVTLAFNYAISPPKAVGAPGESWSWSFHIVNLAIHILAASTLYGLLRRTLRTPRLKDKFGSQAELLALIIAMLWALHPMLSSAVTYVIQRAESMMGLMYFLVLYCGVRAATSRLPIAWYVGAGLACIVGAGSKQIMVTAPLMLILYDLVFLPGPRAAQIRRIVCLVAGAATAGGVVGQQMLALKFGVQAPESYWLYVPIFIPAVAAALYELAVSRRSKSPELAVSVAAPMRNRGLLYLLVFAGWGMLALTLTVTPTVPTAEATAGFGIESVTPAQYAQTEFGVVTRYIQLALAPYPLCLDYEWETATQWYQIWPYAIFLGALLLGSIVAIFRRPAVGFAGLWFFAILAPTSTFMPIKDKYFEFRVYLSLAALIALIVLAVYHYRRWLMERCLLAGAVLSAAMAGTLCAIYFTFGLEPMYFLWFLAWAILPVVAGGILRQFSRDDGQTLGEAARGDRRKTAGEEFPNSTRPSVFTIRNVAGVALAAYFLIPAVVLTLFRNHDFRSEISIWENTLAMRPHNARAHSNMGVVLIYGGHISEGIEHLKLASKNDSKFLDALYNQGVMAGKRGQMAASINFYKIVLSYDPKYIGARLNLAAVYREQNRVDDAMAEYQTVVDQSPKNLQARCALADMLIQTGRLEDAKDQYRACIAVEPGWAPGHLLLARMLLKDSDSKGALAEYQAAIQADPKMAAAYMEAAEILANMGQYKEASDYRLKAQELQAALPEPPTNTHENLGLWIYLATLGLVAMSVGVSLLSRMWLQIERQEA